MKDFKEVAHIHLQPDDELVTRKKGPKENNWAPFQAIGVLNLHNITHSLDNLDIFDRLALVTSSAVKEFVQFKLRRRFKNNWLNYPPKATASERTTFSKNFKALENQGIVKRIPIKNNHVRVLKKNTFMINPYLIKCKEYDNATELWNKL